MIALSEEEAARYRTLNGIGNSMTAEEREEFDTLYQKTIAKHDADVHPPVHPPVDSRAPHGETWVEKTEALTPVHGSSTIYVPAVHPQDMPRSIAPDVVSVGIKEDDHRGVDSPNGKSPTLVSRIVRRRFGKNLRAELGIEVYNFDAKGKNPTPKPPADIAEQLQGLFDFACPWAEDQPTGLYVYDSGVYVPARKMLSRLLRTVLPSGSSKAAYLTEVITYLKDAESHDLEEFDNGEDGWLNTRTCWVNVNTRETRPHSAEHLSLKQLPIDYDPNAKCPSIDALFHQWVDDDHVLVLYENIAQTLVTNDYPIQSVVVLIGSGQNGKSTYLRIVTAFLGKENVSSIELQSFGVNRFATNKLIGKMANVCADMDKKRFANTAEFKKLTGDDPIQAEIKHGALFTFYNYAKIMVSLNQLPPSPDDSDAFHRRIYRLRFERKFAGKARKRMSALLKTAQAEMPGLLNKCLDVLPALLDRQHFHGDTEDVDSKREAYTRGANPIYGFFEDHLAFKASDNGTVKDDLFTKFSAYAKANEIPAMKLEAFFTDLKSEIVKRGYPYETHRVGPEKNRGPRLLKGVVYVEQKAEDDTETKDGEQKSPPPKAKMSEIIETKKGGGS